MAACVRRGREQRTDRRKSRQSARPTLFGTANFVSFAKAQYGEIYDLRARVDGDHFEASTTLQMVVDELFRKKPNPPEQTKAVATATLSADERTPHVVAPNSSPSREWQLAKAQLNRKSVTPSQGKSWEEFCDWAHGLNAPKQTFLYRGHKRSTYPLRTTFHRTGRTDLLRYVGEMQKLSHRLTALTSTRFNLDVLRELERLTSADLTVRALFLLASVQDKKLCSLQSIRCLPWPDDGMTLASVHLRLAKSIVLSEGVSNVRKHSGIAGPRAHVHIWCREVIHHVQRRITRLFLWPTHG